MPSDYKIAGIWWAVFQVDGGRDMHVLPMFDGTEDPMPGHTLGEDCACGPDKQPNPRFKNFIFVHEVVN